MSYIKVCGITNLQDAKLAQKLGARFLGFIFYKASPRYIEPKKAKRIIEKLDSRVEPVGVFVNESVAKIKRLAKHCGIRLIQLHGDEPPRYCDSLKDYEVIKAIRVKNKQSLKSISQYKVSALLFDSFSKDFYGGMGRTFDWKLIKRKFSLPIFISGGINSKNVNKVIKMLEPYAIDVSSSLEKYPGKKDSVLLKRFFAVVKNKVN